MNEKKKIDKSIFSTLLLIFFLGICFFMASLKVNQIATKACFDTLEDTANQVSSDISAHIQSSRQQLALLADVLSTYESLDSTAARKMLRTFKKQDMISVLGLLLPDNELFLSDGSTMHPKEGFDFKTACEQVPFTSGIMNSVFQENTKYIFRAVPIYKEDKIEGILYGFIDLRNLAAFRPAINYNDSVQLYVVDSKSGDFLADTWHDTLGNIYDEAISNRKVKDGYDWDVFRRDIVAEKTGHIVFYSKTAKEYFYSYYMPIGVNHWMIHLTVPESIVFAKVTQIRQILYLLAAIEIIAFMIYFLWIIIGVRKKSKKQKLQLTQTLFMYDVQQTLFDAYKDSGMINLALKKVAKMLTADLAFLILMDDSVSPKFYGWPEGDTIMTKCLRQEFLTDNLPQIYALLFAGKNVIGYPHRMSQFSEDAAVLEAHSISSIMMVPVLDVKEKLIGVLGGVNMQHRWENADLLECISRNFLMAINNVTSYRLIAKIGMEDALTGLKNRNSYQYALTKYNSAKQIPSYCIYMDANGLHELNNHLGHEAGDEMLIFIGKSLKYFFGSEDTYRIGGDEFVTFCHNCTNHKVKKLISDFQEQIMLHGYHISIGVASQDTALHINQLISEAERKMYEAKHQYYKEKGSHTKARELNLKLEQILMEKKDADRFLSIISSYFMGTYIVDMATDQTRVLYKPNYFADILEEYNYNFSVALRSYIHTFVEQKEQIPFLEFIDYNKIDAAICSGQNPEYHYRKKDGTNIILRIYPSDHDTKTNKETFWLFESTK